MTKKSSQHAFILVLLITIKNTKNLLVSLILLFSITAPSLALAEPSVFRLVRCSILAGYAGLKDESQLLELAAIEQGIPDETRTKLQNKIISALDEYYKNDSMNQKQVRIFIRYAGSCEPVIKRAQKIL